MSEELPLAHKYYPALDTLRAIAVLLVIISHWLPYDHFLNSFIPNGPMGVVLFFVLSGYLITGILLEERSRHIADRKSIGKIIKAFYIKRSLRIFPVYYLTLLYLLFTGKEYIKEYFWWHFAYLSNVLFFIKSSWINEYVSPLWSLSVEEQFYIVWPLLILFSGKRAMLAWLLLGVAAGIYFRTLPPNFQKPYSFLQVLTPSCIDCFATGGLIAYVRRFYNSVIPVMKRIIYVLSLMGLAYLFIYVQIYGLNNYISTVFNRNIFSCFAAAYILFVVTRADHAAGLSRDLENGLTVYIGRISYSMYLWHNLIPSLENINSDSQRFFARLAILICLSTFSYFVLEKPLLSLKRFAG